MSPKKVSIRLPTSDEDAKKDKGLIQDIDLLLKEGRKIEAVKLVRWKFSWGLFEAKRFVDKIEENKI